MTVGTYTYGSAAGVAQYVGYMPGAERHFTDATLPTLTTVELMLDQIASEINLKLAEAGYTITLAATVLADAPQAHAYLKQCNEVGAAARVLMTMPLEADPDSETRPNFAAIYKTQLKGIDGSGLESLGLVRSSGASGNLRMVRTGQTDSAGVKRKPLFWIGQFAPTGLREEQATGYDDNSS